MSLSTDALRVLVAPDKFKGSLSAAQVAAALGAGLACRPHVVWRALPLADGGDGSVAAAASAGFTSIPAAVAGPIGEPTTTHLAFDGTTAVVEVATTCGLQMLPPGGLAPLASTSAGFGEAMRAALGLRPNRLVLALGGSATTDGGAGLLSALGAVFLDRLGRPFVPSGGTLRDISRIDLGGLASLEGIEVVAANDVENPLLGPCGAAPVYGPQKGATSDDVAALDAGLAHLVQRLDDAGLPASSCAGTPGAGSAGGLGFAALLLGARMVSGADFFLDLFGFDTAAAEADLVITGEGKLDEQTLSGKLPLAVARRVGKAPVVAVVGHNALGRDALPEHGIERIWALSDLSERDTSRDSELSAALLEQLGQEIGLAGLASSGRVVGGSFSAALESLDAASHT
ncbi:glycerate kinase [Sinomonas terrae]|uniref:Glycerate kinase n=1 Tax=Sinomonas terrae TaxID=2908838 RepID=A0ABS9TVF7_9MICC|nr:glycerate kinase [Sinomonas terrae]MCH6468404.1 glycerate kinase [Sinomonas terrae]